MKRCRKRALDVDRRPSVACSAHRALGVEQPGAHRHPDGVVRGSLDYRVQQRVAPRSRHTVPCERERTRTDAAATKRALCCDLV